MFKPTTLQAAYSIAKVQDLLWAKRASIDKFVRSSVVADNSQFKGVAKIILNSNLSQNQQGSRVLALLGVRNGNNFPKQAKKLTGRYLEEKRHKGLCFWCDERYVFRHRCNRRQLNMLTIVTEELEGFELDGELEVEEVTEGEDIVTPQLFVHALGSTCSHQTMRVRESKGTRTLFLLIDSGSSHNFLDKKISKQLGCEKENIPTLNVAAANGN